MGNSKKHFVMVGIVLGSVATIMVGYTNLTLVKVAPPPNMIAIQNNIAKLEAQRAVNSAATAGWHVGQARQMAVPTDQLVHLQAAVALNQSILSSKNSVKALTPSLQQLAAAKIMNCQVLNEPCSSANRSQVQEIKFYSTTDANTCMSYAASEQKLCKTMSVATLYQNGVVAYRKVVGNTCILNITDCPKHPDWVGKYRAPTPSVNEVQSSCHAEAKDYYKDCRGSNPDGVLATFYDDGVKKDTRNGSGTKR